MTHESMVLLRPDQPILNWVNINHQQSWRDTIKFHNQMETYIQDQNHLGPQGATGWHKHVAHTRKGVNWRTNMG